MNETLLSLALQLSYLFTHLTISNLVDITLVAIVFFVAFQALYQTRALQLLRGVILAAIIGGGLLVLLPLNTLNWLVRISLIAGAIALPLLFQDELRRVLVRLGQVGRSRGTISNFERFKHSLLSAAGQLSSQRDGALIVIEGQTSIQDIIETGVPLQAEVISPELLLTIFSPKTPLHDGAVVLRGDRLVAASCILPVDTEKIGNSQLGTRHKAALGLTRKVQDALVIIISEEKGWISAAFAGKLYLDLSIQELEEWINRFGAQMEETRKFRWGWLRGGGLRSTLVNLFYSILLAVLAWLIVVLQTNPPGQVVLQGVPLTVIGPPPELLMMSDPPDTVNVQVQTTQDRIESITESSIQAAIDLSSLTAGVHSVPVDVSAFDPFIQPTAIKPTSIEVTLEQQLTQMITPTVRILDLSELPPGYVVGEVEQSPQSISATGPRSWVEQVQNARIEIELGSRRADFQESSTPLLYDAEGNLVEGLSIQPEQVLVTVPISKTFFSKEIGIQPVIDESELTPGYEITGIETSPSTVSLMGSEEDLENAGAYLITAPVYLTNQVSEFTTDAPLIVPAGLSIYNNAGEAIRSVQVSVTITPINGYLVLQRQVQVLNLFEDLTATLTPSEVSVLLIGPQFLLEEIGRDPDLVLVNVVLSEGAAGSYLLPVQVQAPAGLQVQSFPDEVEVRIE